MTNPTIKKIIEMIDLNREYIDNAKEQMRYMIKEHEALYHKNEKKENVGDASNE